MAEGEDIWSSRQVLEAICGSSGARGALRGADGRAGEGRGVTAMGLIAGILVRLYAEFEGLLDVGDDLSGGRSRFDKNIEGPSMNRLLDGTQGQDEANRISKEQT